MKLKELNIKNILIGSLLIVIGIFLILTLFSYDQNDNSFFQSDSLKQKQHNFFGTFGSYTSDLLLRAFGLSSFLLTVISFSWSIKIFKSNQLIDWFALCVAPFSVVIFCFLLGNLYNNISTHLPYGISGFVGLGLNKIYFFYFYNIPELYFLIFTSIVFTTLFLISLNLNLSYYKNFFFGFFQVIKFLFNFFLFLFKVKNLSIKNIFSNSKKIRKKTPTFSKAFSKERNINYIFPSLEYLEIISNQNNVETENTRDAKKNTSMLSNVLNDFSIKGNITSVKQGPIVTLYELSPAPGTKTSTVIGLSNDIARSMSAISARISPIAGKDGIGIEIPNKQRETVFLRELLDSHAFKKTDYSLPLVLGKDILGNPVTVDLAKMPHLLVAGTTGSGKSVGINAMILSLLYKCTPEECRLILIDPKMLELSIYQDIPHLLTEVVTDPKKAVIALKWTVKEMEQRYQLMTQLGVREIETYNFKVKKILEKGEIIQKEVQIGFDAETGKPVTEKKTIDFRLFPKIVVIVDELADLMITSGKEIEAAIQRLSQMARAAGIHLIVATQRPSVDVITGTIKSNFPSRISYQVTSKIDSRTILGEQGGEQLLGKGDLLITMTGERLKRVHGPFVKTFEVESVVKHLRSQGEPEYLEAITNEEESDPLFALDLEKSDELYNKAVSIVCREKKASTSFIQRHLQIGYNRAARIIEKMESEGIVSPANHVGRREVLVGKEM
ncbi:MAG: cell division protein FtsK [Rickettsiales bacterium]|nr:cell division protein FtsK [Rickettsiales bacterium]OUV54810.1 MAG: hypothetical protein CBC87_00520 [Rickettsiales bacterium TMED127]|tara:strand:- start:16897 stop:19074 length:2178 start_codon:yes stop_codon:yes gene_type:complete